MLASSTSILAAIYLISKHVEPRALECKRKPSRGFNGILGVLMGSLGF